MDHHRPTPGTTEQPGESSEGLLRQGVWPLFQSKPGTAVVRLLPIPDVLVKSTATAVALASCRPSQIKVPAFHRPPVIGSLPRRILGGGSLNVTARTAKFNSRYANLAWYILLYRYISWGAVPTRTPKFKRLIFEAQLLYTGISLVAVPTRTPKFNLLIFETRLMCVYVLCVLGGGRCFLRRKVVVLMAWTEGWIWSRTSTCNESCASRGPLKTPTSRPKWDMRYDLYDACLCVRSREP